MKLHRFFSFFFLASWASIQQKPRMETESVSHRRLGSQQAGGGAASQLSPKQFFTCRDTLNHLTPAWKVVRWKGLTVPSVGCLQTLAPTHRNTLLTPSEHQGCRHVNVLVVWKYCRWSTIMMLPNKSSVWGCWISTTGAQSGTNVTTMQSVLSGDVCWIWSSFDTFSCCYFELVLTTYLIHMAWNVYMMVHMCSFFDGGVRI